MLLRKGYTPAELPVATLTAGGVIQATQTMGGRFMGVGTLDLAAGLSFLKAYHQPPAFSLLSANLVDGKTLQPVFAPYTLGLAGKLHVAVIGLTDDQEAVGEEGVRVLSWKKVLKSTLATVQSEADFILLLSNFSMAENQEIARTFDRVDCILQVGHVLGNKVPVVIKNTLISQTDIRGKYLGVLDIDWNGHGRWQEGGSAAAEGTNSFYQNRYIALKTTMRDDPEVAAIVKQVQRNIAKISNQH